MEAAQISAPFRRYSSKVNKTDLKDADQSCTSATTSILIWYLRTENIRSITKSILLTCCRIEGKGMRTIPILVARCDNYSHPNGLKWWNPPKLGLARIKKYGFTADFSAHHNIVVTPRQMVPSAAINISK